MKNLILCETKTNETKDLILLKRDTGEMIGSFDLGVKIYTPKQQEAYKAWKADVKKKEIRKIISNELGNFFMLLTDNPFCDLKPETVTKMIMLCTYLSYDGRLMRTQKTPPKKTDIKKILKLSERATYQFISEVKEKYLKESKDGDLFIIHPDIYRGKLDENQKGNTYQMIYINKFRELYNTVNVRKHKQIGHIFKLFPYINIEFNVICKDISETSLNELTTLTAKDFCNLIKYNSNQISRLIKTYNNLKFKVNGKYERLVSFVSDCDNNNKNDIYINPHILYAGHISSYVRAVGKF